MRRRQKHITIERYRTPWLDIQPRRSLLDELRCNTSIRYWVPRLDALIDGTAAVPGIVPHAQALRASDDLQILDVAQLLDDDELQAIILYTLDVGLTEPHGQPVQAGNAYYEINCALRGTRGAPPDAQALPRDTVMRTWKAIVHFLVRALTKLPDVQAVVYCGLRGNIDPDGRAIGDEYTRDRWVRWRAFRSMTTDVLTALGFTGGAADGVLFEIHILHGKDIRQISAFPTENELLLYADSWFVVRQELHAVNDPADPAYGYRKIVLEQRDNPPPVYVV